MDEIELIDWMPQGPDPVYLHAGRWWDAIRVPLAQGWTIADRMEYVPGIVDQRASTLTWLVPVGKVAGSQLPAEAELRRDGAWVEVPPQSVVRRQWETPPRLHWTLPPGDGRAIIVATERLVRAIHRTATGVRHGC